LVGTNRIIEDGLTEDESVIVKGIQRARPGIPVTPAPVAENKAETSEAPAAE
jgi:multidrug efflux system membrane fusion protein